MIFKNSNTFWRNIFENYNFWMNIWNKSEEINLKKINIKNSLQACIFKALRVCIIIHETRRVRVSCYSCILPSPLRGVGEHRRAATMKTGRLH